MTPETNYNQIPEDIKIYIEEAGEFVNDYKEIAKIGFMYANKVIKESTLALNQISGQNPAFINQLKYVVLGRIVRNFRTCPEELKADCTSAKFYYELTSTINEKISPENKFKGTDFTEDSSNQLLTDIVNAVDVDVWVIKIDQFQMNRIRELGRSIVPDNPRGNLDTKSIKHDLNY